VKARAVRWTGLCKSLSFADWCFCLRELQVDQQKLSAFEGARRGMTYPKYLVLTQSETDAKEKSTYVRYTDM
jgi:hypothetical protein